MRARPRAACAGGVTLNTAVPLRPAASLPSSTPPRAAGEVLLGVAEELSGVVAAVLSGVVGLGPSGVGEAPPPAAESGAAVPVLTCQLSGTRSVTEERPSGSRGGAFTGTSTVNGVPGRTSKVLVRRLSRVPSGAVPLALVSAPSRMAVGAAAAGVPGSGNGTRASTCVKKSQPSWAGSDGTSGKPAQPWEAYTRCASRSTAAHVLPRLGEARPLHTPNTFCAAFAGRNVEAQPGPVCEVPRAPPVSRRAGAKGRRPSSPICPGNALGSAAAWNASMASRAASWWLP